MRTHRLSARPRPLSTLAVCVGILVAGLQPLTAQANEGVIAEAPSSVTTPTFDPPVPGDSAAEVDQPLDTASEAADSAPTGPVLAPEAEVIDLAPAEEISEEGPATPVGDWTQVGDQPLEVSTTDQGWEGEVEVEVSVLDVAAEQIPDSAAVAVKLDLRDGEGDGTVALRIPTDVLERGVGGDYAQRLRWYQVSDEVSDAEEFDLSDATALEATTTDDHVTVTPKMSRQSSTVMAVSAASSDTGTGNYAATPLKSSSSWDVAEQTGAFTWNYSMAVPTAGVGPEPALGLAYNSQAVDGLTGSTNNQPSFVGEGWELTAAGFIERRYVPCALDDGPSGAVAASGDLCWKSDNATVSMAGHSGALVRDSSSGAWRLANDDGTRFEKLVGTGQGCADNGTSNVECWRMTTTDGTQYFFGLNRLPGWSSGKPVTNSAWTVPVFGNDAGEPCKASTFAASSCMQGWRWNLDYVVDVHGNAMAYYYTAETNKYAKNGSGATTYTRGGAVARIEYGLRSNDLFSATAAGYKVRFTYDARGRCSDSSGNTCTSQTLDNASRPATTASYPDVPWDQLCTASSCSSTQISPTFFTNARLATVEADVLVGGSYSETDSWTLSHSFPAPGDGTSAALWLTRVQHAGSRAGLPAVTESPTDFSGKTLQNRVWTVDGLVPLAKWRLTSIKDSLGAVTSVNYAAAQCTASEAPTILQNPQSNTKWCFPEWWSPRDVASSEPRLDLFHKYRVQSINVDDVTGPALSEVIRTQYTYGTPRWRYNDAPTMPSTRRTWNIFAGVDTTEAREGDPAEPSAQKVTKTWYYQGMNGDRATTSGGAKTATVTGTTISDERWFAGQTHRQQVLLGVGGTVVSDTTTTPWASPVTATDGSLQARMVRAARTLLSEPLSTGGNRTVDTQTSFSTPYGLPTSQSVATSDAGAKCVTTSYATANTSKWIIGAPSEVKSVAKGCDALASAEYPRDLISQERMEYDGAGWGNAPSRGLSTTKEAVTSFANGKAVWSAVSKSTYDALGRPLVTTDPLGRTTTLTYTPAAKVPSTGSSSTNTAPFNWTSNTTFEPTTGTAATSTDANGAVTTVDVDALGRIANVWLPLRPKAANPSSPSYSYEYTRSRSAPNAVKTTTYKAGASVISYDLYDGLARKVQSQTVASGSGSVITTTAYDNQGRAWLTDKPYWTTSVDPSVVLFVPDSQNAVPSAEVTSYDAVGRVTKLATLGLGQEQYASTSAYIAADRVDTVPPAGETPHSTFVNSLNQQVKLTQYLSASTSGTAQSTNYSYDAAGNLQTMTDPAGNSWTWTYDLRGYRVSQSDPDAGSSTATFDDVGNQTSTTDARGQTISSTYDALNRKTATYAGGTDGALLSSWTFDTLKKGLVTNSSAFVGSVPGAPGSAYSTNVVSYDAGGNVTRSTVVIPSSAPGFAGSYTSTAGYYADSSPSVKTLPAMGGLPSEQVLYSYDSLGQLSGIGGNGGVLNSTVYTPIGQVAQFNRLNGNAEAYSTYGYDSVSGAVMNIKDNAVFNGKGNWVADRVYARDDAGNVTSLSTTSALPTATTQVNCYGYDALRQLTRVWTPSSAAACQQAPSAAALVGPAPMWKDYSYDTKTGNRLKVVTRAQSGSSSTSTYTYPTAGAPSPHAPSVVTGAASAGGGSYGYDEAGNMTARPGQTLTFNEFGKVATTTNTTTGATSANTYDASGQLLLRNSSVEGVSLYLNGTVLTKAPNSAVISGTRTYVAAGGVPVAQRSAKSGTAGSVMTWLFVDAQGTVDTQTVAATGVTAKQYRDPFGMAAGSSSGTWAGGEGFLNKLTTPSTGLTDIGARTYDSRLGKFISVDPVVDPSKPRQNTGYAYSGNNPVTWSDPTGLRLDEGCGWGRSCSAQPVSKPPAWSDALAAAKKFAEASRATLNAIPTRNPFTVTPAELKADAKARAGAYATSSAASFFASEQGAMIYGWAKGGYPSFVIYNSASKITQGIQDSAYLETYRKRLKADLAAGRGPGSGYYDAGDPSGDNPDFIRDVITFTNWESASNSDRSLAVVGSFALSATVKPVAESSAVVTFYASNDTTLGSGMAFSDELRDFGNSLPAANGSFAVSSQTFYWSEPISW